MAFGANPGEGMSQNSWGRATKDFPIDLAPPRTVRSIEDLMRDGRAAAASRGHQLGTFSRSFESSSGREWATAKCQTCRAEVVAESLLRANGIDLAGEAVATNCRARAGKCVACDEGAPLQGGRRHACLLTPPIEGSGSQAEKLDKARVAWLNEARLLLAKVQDHADKAPYGFARYGGRLKAAIVSEAMEEMDGLERQDWRPAI